MMSIVRKMKQSNSSWILDKALFTFFFLMCVTVFSSLCYAKGNKEAISGTLHEFESSGHYRIPSEEVSKTATNQTNTLGEFYIKGDIEIEEKEDVDVPSFTLSDGGLKFYYDFDKDILKRKDKEWHLVNDDWTTVNNNYVGGAIKKGVLVVETSLDGKNWYVDKTKRNLFNKKYDPEKAVYSAKIIHLENGCYYRVTFAYKMQKVLSNSAVLFIDTSDYVTKKYSEEYIFYVEDSESAKLDPSEEPRKTLGSKVNTGRDNGYSGNDKVKEGDPHYGWDIGSFFVNGYTRVNSEGETPVFLKNVGDKVTLWFRLEQDINKLNGKDKLVISEDANGYDEDFETKKTNFNHGALLIQFTDYQGKKHDPVIYTNFLEANTIAGADTKVKLFEEGDYEVHLDYEILDDSMKVATVDVRTPDKYHNYKVYFKFSIRNGNCMVYPFDIATGAELPDQAITPNGFKLDMAKSRYLQIDVTRASLTEESNGTRTADVRFNRPAKDGEEYTEPGIYTFDVKNQVTGEHTQKSIYVGDDIYYKALAKSNLSVNDINAAILAGGEIQEDGSIVSTQ